MKVIASILGSLVLIGVIFLLVYFFIVKPHFEANAVVDKTQTTFSGSRTISGSDAVNTVQQATQAEESVDAQTKEATDEINKTSGAHVAVAHDTNYAGIRAICMRDAYRDSPRCRAVLGSRP